MRNFAFAMNIAAVVGTYSSLFIAARWRSGSTVSTRSAARAGPGQPYATRDESEIDEADGDDGEGRV